MTSDLRKLDFGVLNIDSVCENGEAGLGQKLLSVETSLVLEFSIFGNCTWDFSKILTASELIPLLAQLGRRHVLGSLNNFGRRSQKISDQNPAEVLTEDGA